MKIKPHTVESRLWNWGKFEVQGRISIGRTASPFGKIADDRNAAGNHGKGMRYEMVDDVPCRPDGGHSADVERRGRLISHNIQCTETQQAVAMLPDDIRRIVIETYVVKGGDKPRSCRAVAARLNLANHVIVFRALKVAHQMVGRRIFGPFEIVEDERLPQPKVYSHTPTGAHASAVVES